MRIVIVDDELLVVKTLAAALTNAGHHVVGKAGDVARGLQLFEEITADIAILDINLNGISAEPLLAKAVSRSIPVLLISGYSEKQRPAWAKSAGFLAKPFEVAELLSAVEGLGNRFHHPSG